MKSKMNNKRGQFFLIASMIIIIIASTIMNVSNSVAEKKDIKKLGDLSNELYIESGYLIEEGAYDGLSDEEMKNLSRDFAQKYVDYIQEKNNYYFLFGRKQGTNSNLSFLYYQEIIPEEICLNLTGKCELLNGDGEISTFYLSGLSNPFNANLIINNTQIKSFSINEGDNFYFSIWGYNNNGDKEWIP